MSLETEKLKTIIEAALMAFGQPLSVDRILSLFGEEEEVSRQEVREALQQLQDDCAMRGVELVEVSSGFRYQAKKDFAPWVAKLWEEKPPRYSRALLETLVLVAYKQPITRHEIEDIRGVSASSHIMKTLQERDWVRIVGHKDVPGKPALYATTKAFLDYFNMKSLDELPSLMEIRDLDKIGQQLNAAEVGDAAARLQGEPGEAEATLVETEQADESSEVSLSDQEQVAAAMTDEVQAATAQSEAQSENIQGAAEEVSIYDETNAVIESQESQETETEWHDEAGQLEDEIEARMDEPQTLAETASEDVELNLDHQGYAQAGQEAALVAEAETDSFETEESAMADDVDNEPVFFSPDQDVESEVDSFDVQASDDESLEMEQSSDEATTAEEETDYAAPVYDMSQDDDDGDSYEDEEYHRDRLTAAEPNA